MQIHWYPHHYHQGLCTLEDLGKVRPEFLATEPEPPAKAEQQPVLPEEPPVVNNQLPEEGQPDNGDEVEPSPVAQPKRKGK
jgi:hypothetical protein